MKAILEFNLPEDQRKYDLVNKSDGIYNVLYELDSYLRGISKYGHQDFKESEYKVVEKIRKHLNELMVEEKIDFD